MQRKSGVFASGGRAGTHFGHVTCVDLSITVTGVFRVCEACSMRRGCRGYRRGCRRGCGCGRWYLKVLGGWLRVVDVVYAVF